MPEYTKEMIAKAKEWLLSGDEYDKEQATFILSALPTAEQERELYEKSIDGWKFRATHAEARCVELEKAGEMLANIFRPLNTTPRWQDALDAWDAARKEKP